MEGTRTEERLGGLFAAPEALTRHLKAIGLADGPRMLLEQLWWTSRHEGPRGARQVSISRLARELAVSPRAIIYWRDELIAYGFLATHEPPRGRTLIIVTDMAAVWSCEGLRYSEPAADVTPFLAADDAQHVAPDVARHVAKHIATDVANHVANPIPTSYERMNEDLSINPSSGIVENAPGVPIERSIDDFENREGEELPLEAFDARTSPAALYRVVKRWHDETTSESRPALERVLGAILAARAAENVTDLRRYVVTCLARGVRDGWIKRARDLIHQVEPKQQLSQSELDLQRLRETPGRRLSGVEMRGLLEQRQSRQ